MKWMINRVYMCGDMDRGDKLRHSNITLRGLYEDTGMHQRWADSDKFSYSN